MSTHKTEHFGLHKWEGGDDFLRSEFNENFAALDGAARVVTGSYTGDGANWRTIELGFTPVAVMMTTSTGFTSSNSGPMGGLSLSGAPIKDGSFSAIEIVEGGFRVGINAYICTNSSNRTYHYIAVR